MKELPNLMRELRRAREKIKQCIPGSCDIGFQCSNMRIETNNTSDDMELRNQDFKTQVERHEEFTKLEEGVEKRPRVN